MRSLIAWALALPGLALSGRARAQRPDSAVQWDTAKPPMTAAEADADMEEGPQRLFFGKPYNLGFTTVEFGGGLLTEYGAFAQNAASKEQFALHAQWKLRDARLIFGGRFNIERPVTWQLGVMYDGSTGEWMIRQTGIMIGVPELWGNIFVGRAKVGISLNRIMVGYDGWTMERFTFSDASLPLLGDGIKWLGYSPDHHLIWNVGWFTGALNHTQSFGWYDNQFTGRLVWLPLGSDATGTVLSLGISGGIAKVHADSLRTRSRPEDFIAPYFLDTGEFPATNADNVGFEAYLRQGPWLFGTEYYLMPISSPQTHNPVFNGGDIFVSRFITPGFRPYNTAGGYFKSVTPDKSVFQGGLGAFEALLRFSYSGLNAGTLNGGDFWRISPTVNWYLSPSIRLSAAYGYGVLDRFQLSGATQFFQMRLALMP
jgi:phosphate-selective porin OprO and OprP